MHNSAGQVSAPLKRPGGRTARTREAVLTAIATMLMDSGAEGISSEKLAARSGINRSTIYRRWGTMGAVVADLASQLASELTYPRTGSLEGDIAHVITQIGEMLTPDSCRLIQALIAWRNEAVQEAMAAFWASRREAVAEIVARYDTEVDVAVLVRLFAGPLYYSALIENRSPSSGDIDATIAAATAWLRTQPRRLA